MALAPPPTGKQWAGINLLGGKWKNYPGLVVPCCRECNNHYMSQVETRIADLKSRVATGDVREGTIRALLYVGIPRAAVDARGFEAIRRLRAVRYDVQRPALAEFKRMVHEQAFILLLD